MQDRHDQEPPERSRTAEQHWGPADSLFPRLHRQSSLLAAAEAWA